MAKQGYGKEVGLTRVYSKLRRWDHTHERERGRERERGAVSDIANLEVVIAVGGGCCQPCSPHPSATPASSSS